MIRKLVYLMFVFAVLGLTGLAVAQEVDMEIGYAIQAPVIDGEVDDIWEGATTQYIVPLEDPNNASGTWKALYDSMNLYVIVDVTDANLVNDSDGAWQDDSVEFYFDGGNTKEGPPLEGDNRQYTFGWATDEIQGTNTVLDGVEQAQVDTETGWRIEIKLPWLSLQGMDPLAGDLTGIDCFYNDDDDGGDSREAQIYTFALDGSAWNDASQWGTAMLLAVPSSKDPVPADGADGVSIDPVVSTFISSDVPMDIPDWSWTTQKNILGEATSMLEVSESINIKDLNVELDITMPGGSNGDLNVYLASPDGKKVKLFDDIGVLTSHFTNTILDDEATSAITSAKGPYRGIYKPEGKLSDFDNRDSQGTWELEIIDDWPGGPGTLNSWRIVIENPITVSWTPGEGLSQDIYFSENYDDVNGIGDAGLLANLPMDATSIEIGALALDTMYYWRVDEIGEDGVALNMGDIWSFSTPLGNVLIQKRIASGADDAEEDLNPEKLGEVDQTSSDLEMPYEDTGMGDPQIVGLRFVDIDLHPDTLILESSVQFEVDEIKDGALPVNLIIEGELNPNPGEFIAGEPNTFDISSRPRTETMVQWSVPAWENVDDQGPDQATLDISPIIQEIIGQSDWAGGNALVLIISDDPCNPSEGNRCAESYDGDPDAAPLLNISAVTETAGNPSPANGAIDVLQETILGWSGGFTSVARDVYFGAENPPAKLDQTTGRTYDIGKLAVSSTYYWKINEYDSDGNKHEGSVWSFTTVIGEATNPSPADQAMDVPVDVVFTWTPGATAISHDGYLGTTDPPEFLGNTEENFFDTADIGGLVPGTTYYWRLDAVEADGTTHVGEVWSFTTQPDQATDPSPADGVYLDGAEGMLSWTPGQDALSHDVYFGTDPDALEFVINQTEALLAIGEPNGPAPEGLVPGTTYYWRIDEVYTAVTGTGKVWSFTSKPPDHAYNPDPADGAVDVPTDVQLSWTPGFEATLHYVHFGDSLDKVSAAGGAAPISDTTFDPGPLEPGKTYYWRVDEFCSPNTIKGGVWSFTTAELKPEPAPEPEPEPEPKPEPEL